MSNYSRPLWPLIIALAVPAAIVLLGGIVVAVAYYSESQSQEQPSQEATRQRRSIGGTEQERLASKPARLPESEIQGKPLPPDTRTPPLISEVAKEKKIVEEFLHRVLDDPSGMQIVEWGETRKGLFSKLEPQVGGADDALIAIQSGIDPEAKKEYDERQARRQYKPCAVLRLRFRAKNRLGALVINESLFLVQDGIVSGSAQVKSDAPVPHDVMVSIALAEIGVFKPEPNKP
jgi:hypothetical protein